MVIPVVFWSGSGNTEKMAQAVADAINAAGAEAKLMQVSETSADEVAGYDVMALGCPAMGSEQLEECEFEPFMAELEAKLGGKKVALFGSYGWGGTYMDEWKARCEGAGADVADPVLANNEPDDDVLTACAELGKGLVG